MTTLGVSARVLIDAPPAVSRAVFADWRSWPEVFPKIHGVRPAPEPQQHGVLAVDVDHDEGIVRNWLAQGTTTVDLWERKRRYTAHFANTFAGAGESTLCRVRGTLQVPPWVALVRPVVGRYAGRQVMANTLEPLRVAATAFAASIGFSLRGDELTVRPASGNARAVAPHHHQPIRSVAADFCATEATVLLRAQATDPTLGTVLRLGRGGSVLWRQELRCSDPDDEYAALETDLTGELVVISTRRGRSAELLTKTGQIVGVDRGEVS